MALTAHLRSKLASLNEFGGNAYKPGATVQQASAIHDQFLEARAALSLAVEELERIDRLMQVVPSDLEARLDDALAPYDGLTGRPFPVAEAAVDVA